MMDSQSGAEARMPLRPNMRNKTCGDALMRASAIPLARPGGDIAGARAMKTLTCWFNLGWIERAAKACAVPCEKPI